MSVRRMLLCLLAANAGVCDARAATCAVATSLAIARHRSPTLQQPQAPVDPEALEPLPPPPVGLHLGVLCDKTFNPITGYRYTRAGSQPSYDLCQAEFDKLSTQEQQRFERVAPQLTPRRAVVALLAGAASLWFATSAPPPPPRRDYDAYDDLYELPPLSPAEELVDFFFKPKVPASEREDSSLRRLVPPAGAEEADDSVEACDAACRQRIADRRALFEQSRTTSDRQKILDLSRQRAAMYNTTFRGADCNAFPGIPCL